MSLLIVVSRLQCSSNNRSGAIRQNTYAPIRALGWPRSVLEWLPFEMFFLHTHGHLFPRAISLTMILPCVPFEVIDAVNASRPFPSEILVWGFCQFIPTQIWTHLAGFFSALHLLS